MHLALATTIRSQDLKPIECTKALIMKEEKIDLMTERDKVRTEKKKVKIPPHKMNQSTKIIQFLI